MTTWLVLFKERTFLTRTEGEYIETFVVKEEIKTEIDECFEPCKSGIKFFKACHEGVEGNYSVEVEVLSWSEMKEDYDDEM